MPPADAADWQPYHLTLDVVSFFPKHWRGRGGDVASWHTCTRKEEHRLNVLLSFLLKASHQESGLQLAGYYRRSEALHTVWGLAQQNPFWRPLLPQALQQALDAEKKPSWWGVEEAYWRHRFQKAPATPFVENAPRRLWVSTLWSENGAFCLPEDVEAHLHLADDEALFGSPRPFLRWLPQAERHPLLLSSSFAASAMEAFILPTLEEATDAETMEVAFESLFWYPFGLPSYPLHAFATHPKREPASEAAPIDAAYLANTEAWLKAGFDQQQPTDSQPPAPSFQTKTSKEAPLPFVLTWAKNDPEMVLPGYLKYRQKHPESQLRLLVWSDDTADSDRWTQWLTALPPTAQRKILVCEVPSPRRRLALHQLAVASIALCTNPHEALLEVLLSVEAHCPLITLYTPFHADWVGDAGVAIPVEDPELLYEALTQLFQKNTLLYQRLQSHAKQQWHSWNTQERLRIWLEELGSVLPKQASVSEV